MVKRTLVAFALIMLVGLLAACPKRTTRTLPEYQLGPEEAYLGGKVVDLYEHQVLNRRDFVYTMAFDQSGAHVAYPHMVMTDFELSLAAVDSGEIKWHMPLNPTEFDVEGAAFVHPDGVVVAARRSASSNHPTLRLFASEGGAERAVSFSDDERGYAQVAARADGAVLAAVSVKEGNLVLHAPDTLIWAGEIRAHRGSANAIAFAPDGTIYTGGHDKTIARWRLLPGAPELGGTVRVAVVDVGEAKDRVIPAALAGRTPVLLAVNTGLQTTAITRAAAELAGLPTDGQAREITTSAGKLTVPEVTLPSLLFKGVSTGPLPAVICDECIPVGVDGILGDELKDQVRVDFGPLPHVATVEVKAATSAPALPVETPAPAPPPGEGEKTPAAGAAGDGAEATIMHRLELIKRFVLPGAVNDLRISRDGKTLCVAISSQPAERTLELYEREKAGEFPEPSAQNAALIVDAESGEVRKTFEGHRSYTVTADLSPDGRTLVSGGWDNHLLLFDVETGEISKDIELSWLVRRVRFSPDGRTLAVAAWTPPNSGGGDSKPAAVLYDVVYEAPEKLR